MKFEHDQFEIGQGLVEYGLIIAGVVLVVILALSVTGASINDVYCQAVDVFDADGCGCGYTFDDPAELNDWEGKNTEGQLSIQEGKLCHSGNDKVFLKGCIDHLGSSNFTMNLNGIDIEQTGSGNTGFDLFFRTSDPANGYHFTYNSRVNRVVFWKRVDWKWIALSINKVSPDWGNEELDFQIKVEGDTFSAFKDGELILQASDDAYPSGEVGLRNKPGSTTCLDGFSINQTH